MSKLTKCPNWLNVLTYRPNWPNRPNVFRLRICGYQSRSRGCYTRDDAIQFTNALAICSNGDTHAETTTNFHQPFVTPQLLVEPNQRPGRAMDISRNYQQPAQPSAKLRGAHEAIQQGLRNHSLPQRTDAVPGKATNRPLDNQTQPTTRHTISSRPANTTTNLSRKKRLNLGKAHLERVWD